jgi:CheY-like chemotaxis protein
MTMKQSAYRATVQWMASPACLKPYTRMSDSIVTEKGTDRAIERGRPRNILIVDDNEDAAAVLAEVLQALGHTVMVAHDAANALEILGRFAADVAILDIGLPEVDGHELARKIRARLGDRTPHLLAVTGYGQEHDRRRSAAAGFEQHFVKPVRPEQLVEAIDRMG